MNVLDNAISILHYPNEAKYEFPKKMTVLILTVIY